MKTWHTTWCIPLSKTWFCRCNLLRSRTFDGKHIDGCWLDAVRWQMPCSLRCQNFCTVYNSSTQPFTLWHVSLLKTDNMLHFALINSFGIMSINCWASSGMPVLVVSSDDSFEASSIPADLIILLLTTSACNWMRVTAYYRFSSIDTRQQHISTRQQNFDIVQAWVNLIPR